MAMCCVRWRGAFRPVYGKRTEQSAIRLCGWSCDGSGVNGRKVPQTKGYPFSHGKAQRKITVEKTGKTIRGCRDKHQGTYLNGMAHGKFRM